MGTPLIFVLLLSVSAMAENKTGAKNVSQRIYDEQRKNLHYDKISCLVILPITMRGRDIYFGRNSYEALKDQLGEQQMFESAKSFKACFVKVVFKPTVKFENPIFKLSAGGLLDYTTDYRQFVTCDQRKYGEKKKKLNILFAQCPVSDGCNAGLINDLLPFEYTHSKFDECFNRNFEDPELAVYPFVGELIALAFFFLFFCVLALCLRCWCGHIQKENQLILEEIERDNNNNAKADKALAQGNVRLKKD